MKVDLNVFKHKIENYKNEINPISDYIKQASTFLSIHKGISIEEATKLVKDKLKKRKIKNPIVTYNSRQDNNDMIIEKTTLTNYIEQVKVRNEVMVPSFTCYTHPSKQKSLLSEFMMKNVKERAGYKKLAFQYAMAQSDDPVEQYKNQIMASVYDTRQAAKKRNNNGASGAFASLSTHLYNPTAHYSLTSITRCVASIGNALSESFIAGNKLFTTPDIVLSYFSAILANVNMDTVEQAIKQFNLVAPSIDDVMTNVKFCTDKYWNIPKKLEAIRSFVSKLTDVQRSAILYLNDFRSLAELNPDFVKSILLDLSREIIEDPELKTREDMLKAIDNTQEGVMTLVHHICMEDIRGIIVKYNELEDKKLMKLSATAKHIAEGLTKLSLLFSAFYKTSIMPCNIANIKIMLRECIVLSDTDSTCGSYDWWVKFVHQDLKFDNQGIGVAALVMTMTTQIMDHFIKILSGNMNVDKDRIEMLKMKNEYFWYMFATMNASKHYFADTAIKEGMVFQKSKPELKGVNMIAGNIDAYFRNKSREMMDKIKEDIKNGVEIDDYKYIKEVADIEREIIEKVRNADLNVLKLDKIKDAKGYKQDADKSPYTNHILWMEAFAPKYGDPGEPTYLTVKVPLLTDSKASMDEWLNRLSETDPIMVGKIKNYMAKYNKQYIGTFRPPLNIVRGTGLPKEILDIIDYKRIVNDNCLVFYMILESIGFYKKDELLISEMGLY